MTIPKSWHKLPNPDAVERLAWSAGTTVEVDEARGVQLTETEVGTYYAPLTKAVAG